MVCTLSILLLVIIPFISQLPVVGILGQKAVALARQCFELEGSGNPEDVLASDSSDSSAALSPKLFLPDAIPEEGKVALSDIHQESAAFSLQVGSSLIWGRCSELAAPHDTGETSEGGCPEQPLRAPVNLAFSSGSDPSRA